MGKKEAKKGKAGKATAVEGKAKAKGTSTRATKDLNDILNPTTVRANIKAFVAWVEEQGGPKIKPEHAQAVVTGYKKFQQSEAGKAYRDEAATERAEAAAARKAAREAKAADADKAKAEKAEAKAAKAKADKESKTAKPAKTAAASSKKGASKKAAAAAPTAKAGGKQAAKKAPAKKAGAKAPY